MLRLIYIFGWVPALIAGAAVRSAAGPTHVLSDAGEAGMRAAVGLGLTLALLSGGYLSAIRRPPPLRTLLIACFGSLLVALAMPVLFSADVFAYAYYGDLALHGQNPYGHGEARLDDPLARAAEAAWDGHIPPRCVYGPVAVAIAALADIAGAAAGVGVGGQIAAQRLAAVAAYAAFAVLALRLVGEPRARAALLLNPVVLWSVAEGHNDAAMVALLFGGLVVARGRALVFALAALVKAPAVLLFGTLARNGPTAAGLAIVGVGYLPLIVALLTGADNAGGIATSSSAPAASAASAWQSPLGLLAEFAGRGPAIGIALGALGALFVTLRGLAARDRTAALALAAWFTLPNAYPWYALWIVPLAIRRLDSAWSRALLAASLCGAVRAMLDAIFRAPSTFGAVRTFHGRMIALEFLPPLGVLAFAALRRRKPAVPVAVIIAVALCRLSAEAHGVAASPLLTPAARIAALSEAARVAAGSQATPAPAPQPAASAPTPQPGMSMPPTIPQPAVPLQAPTGAAPTASGAPPVPSPLPTPATPTSPSPWGSPPPMPSGSPAPPQATAPAMNVPVAPPVLPPTPTPNSYNYVITPTPVPVTSPDGPHIIEIFLNDRQIHAGGALVVRVLTSPNVVGVEARALGRFIAIPQNSPGLFSLAYRMPGGIPFWLLNRNYNIVIAAATADGRQTAVSFPMLLTR